MHVVTAAPEFVFTREALFSTASNLFWSSTYRSHVLWQIASPDLHIRSALLDCGAVQEPPSLPVRPNPVECLVTLLVFAGALKASPCSALAVRRAHGRP